MDNQRCMRDDFAILDEIAHRTEDNLSHDAPGLAEQFWWPAQNQ